MTLVFALADGAGPCTLTGYPGVDSGAGGPLVHAQRTMHGYMGGLPADVSEPPTVTLTPSQQAQSIVEGVAVDPTGGDNKCPTYTDLRVTAPDTTEPSRCRPASTPANCRCTPSQPLRLNRLADACHRSTF